MKVFEEYRFAGWRECETYSTLRSHGGTYGGGTESIVMEETTYSMGHDARSAQVRNSKEDDVNGTLQSRASTNLQSNNVVRQQYAVRRLTLLECERLQGLPDGYTLIDDKTCSDSARYKALGNGMCQNCADFVIRQIVEVTENEID